MIGNSKETWSWMPAAAFDILNHILNECRNKAENTRRSYELKNNNPGRLWIKLSYSRFVCRKLRKPITAVKLWVHIWKLNLKCNLLPQPAALRDWTDFSIREQSLPRKRSFSSRSVLSEGNYGLVVHAFKICINKLLCQGWYCVTEPTSQIRNFSGNNAIIYPNRLQLTITVIRWCSSVLAQKMKKMKLVFLISL